MIIRIANEGDAEHIANLCVQLGYKTSKDEVKLRLRNAFDDKHNVIYVAEVDQKVLGWLEVAVRQTIESGEYAEITGLIVDKADRGKGIGRGLVKEAEEWARKMGQRTIRVRTNVIRKEAPLFYHALGLKEIKKQSVFSKSI